MNGFRADWLALREPHDLRARNPSVLSAVLAFISSARNANIVDLGCGTGSTLRAVAPRLTTAQNWRLIDNDAILLAKAAEMKLPIGAIATTAWIDLSRNLDAALVGSTDLVTTSALLDLVSDAWLGRFARELAARSLPVYAALTYDGRIEFCPRSAFDDAMTAALNRHQHRDKGFGLALGSSAAYAAIALFESLGYTVLHGAADWVIEPHDRDLQTALLAGWTDALNELDAGIAAQTEQWLTFHRSAIDVGCSSIRVGHIDLFAMPSSTR